MNCMKGVCLGLGREGRAREEGWADIVSKSIYKYVRHVFFLLHFYVLMCESAPYILGPAGRQSLWLRDNKMQIVSFVCTWNLERSLFCFFFLAILRKWAFIHGDCDNKRKTPSKEDSAVNVHHFTDHLFRMFLYFVSQFIYIHAFVVHCIRVRVQYAL